MEVKQEGDFKIKSKPKKPKNLGKKNEITKVEIPNTAPAAQGEVLDSVTKVVVKTGDATLPEPIVDAVVDENVVVVNDTTVEELDSVIQEITDEPDSIVDTQTVVQDAITQSNIELPENIEKLVNFMKEVPGSTIEDYVRLNADYSSINEQTLLEEYYKKTKPHLDAEDIKIILEDFSYDEELDDDREIRKTKIAFKEEVAKAKGFLEDTKSKYYDEIKLRPGVTQDQQKAVDFFNRFNEDQQATVEKHNIFLQKTKNLLNDDFKGFDFNVGEKKFRYGVKNVNEVVEAQSDITTFIGKFLDKDGNISDAKGYHKALYAARNADTIAQHFYEQGKSDTVKSVMAKSKNITTEPRQNASGSVFVNGIKVKAINGVDSSKLKIKTRKFN
tara:strand:+ start:3517 stop:4677 length:1161 start_codon:yes stop_codon:yes gene_type:complete